MWGYMLGKLITFEGIEGCGKTTQVDRTCHWLERQGRPFLQTREPGGTEIGRQIRKILLDTRNRTLDAMTELLLYAADRAQHVRERIRPALEHGEWVLCDRFTDATLAYQGEGRGLDRQTIATLNEMAAGGVKPDLTLLIDLPVQVGLSRAIRRNHQEGLTAAEGRFEAEETAFHDRVRRGYLRMAEAEPKRFRLLDGNRDPDEIHREILSLLSHYL